MEHDVDTGDIWRMCQTKDAAIQDWVRLAVGRARETGAPAVFWLDETRAHDAELLHKVRPALAAARHRRAARSRSSTSPRRPGSRSSAPARRGHDLGHRQRAARLPHRPVPDPRARHEREDAVDRPADERRRPVRDRAPAARRPSTSSSSCKENHLRWDSLGEFLALPPSLELLAETDDKPAGHGCSATTLDRATGRVLEENRSPSRKTGELDNRGSHFYLALYWAQELAAQDEDAELAERFAPLAQRLADARGDDRRGARPRSRARRSTSAATTAPTPSGWPRRCARARRSTRHWPRCRGSTARRRTRRRACAFR